MQKKQDDKQVTRVVAIIIAVACVVWLGFIICNGGPKGVLDLIGCCMGGFSAMLLSILFASWFL